METQTIIQTAESSLLHTYNRFPIVLDHGEDVYLYDTDQKKYLDFAAGIAAVSYTHLNTTRFHTNNTVFNDINDSYSVCTTNLI